MRVICFASCPLPTGADSYRTGSLRPEWRRRRHEASSAAGGPVSELRRYKLLACVRFISLARGWYSKDRMPNRFSPGGDIEGPRGNPTSQ
jgi:hypothetical protein